MTDRVDRPLRAASQAVLTLLENTHEEMRGNKGLPDAYLQEKLLESLLGSPEVENLREAVGEVQPLDHTTPWSLRFDRDGTEDVAIICDRHEDELVRSRHFWLPEGDDPVPLNLAAVRAMVAAPRLLDACKQALAAMEAALEVNDPQARTQMEWEAESLATLRLVIAEAIGEEP